MPRNVFTGRPNLRVMEIRIVPYSPEHEPAAQAFNERLRARGESEFQLPDRTPEPEPLGLSIRKTHFLALENDSVRGGFLLVRYPSWLAGRELDVANSQDPLSEGIADPKYASVALRLLKGIQQHGPYVFAAGMGSAEARFARLLKGAGWTVQLVPFLFHIARVNPFLRELPALQSSGLKRAAAAVGRTGIGKAAVFALQSKSIRASFRLRGATIERVHEWGPWADTLWEDFRSSCSFCVKRDRRTLQELYRLGEDRSQAFLISRSGRPVGWVTAQNSQMAGHKHFGSMRVATILDCVAYPEAREATVLLAARSLASGGADLIITNQSYQPWIQAFRNVGFLTASSNYVFASSKSLSQAIAAVPNGRERIHFTRGDSDGRIHL